MTSPPRQAVDPVRDMPPTGGAAHPRETTGVELGSRPFLLETVDDAAVVQLYADGFTSLSRAERILCWHLYQAALAGRDIYWDQRYAHGLEARELLEEILTHGDGIAAKTLDEIRRYLKLLWLNSGPHNNLTGRKFLLDCGPEDLREAACRAVEAGARLPTRSGEDVAGLLGRLGPVFFDAGHDALLVTRSADAGVDVLAAGANNLYVGVRLPDLEGFEERYPLNSRLVKGSDGRLVEEVYRLGGRYDALIRRIVGHLEDAAAVAPEPTRDALAALVRYYRTGAVADRLAYDVAWVRNADARVDTINGFTEVYLDPRGVKGAWEAVVYYVDEAKTAAIRVLADEAQWFEDRLPCDARFRRPAVTGVTGQAIEVLVETGDAGPITAIGINLPNDPAVRERYGSRSVSLANVADAYERSTPPAFRREFAWTPDEAARAERWSAAITELMVNLHEVIGHGSGRVDTRLGGDPAAALQGHYSSIEEARAELVALYFIADPRLVALGLVPEAHQREVVLAAYEAFTRTAVVQLRRVRTGTRLEQDHMRARQLVVHWLIEHTESIEVRRRDGRTSYVVRDVEEYRAGVARLLSEVQRIKSEGDRAAADRLLSAYGDRFDPVLRDEVVRRVASLHLPSYTGFVQPRLTPVHDERGALADVLVSYPRDLTIQMLEYSGKAQPGS